MEQRTVNKSVKTGDSKIEISWDLSDIPYDFAKKDDGSLAIFGCGCSSFKADEKMIKGSYDLVVGEDNISKRFHLFFDDGEPLMVKNSKGVMAKNFQGKAYIPLAFNLTIRK